MITHDNGAATFVSLVRPFLLVISHKDLLNCLAVDTSVGAIFNFISGSNGSRAIPFLRTLLGSLNNLPTDDMQASPAALETFTGATISLREILWREQRAIFHDELPALVGDFEEFSRALSTQHPTVAFRTNSVLTEVRGMIARVRGLLHNEGPKVNGVSTTVITSTFPREIELPGGRHENDMDDIADIQILPTENEIKSERKEYLPSTDRDQPHHLSDTVQRHIDTNFRLYRHDIFGALKDHIGGFMLAVEKNPALMNSPKIIIGDIRSSCIFRNAHVSDIRLHPRRDLEAFLTFTQPQPLRPSTAVDRHRWWNESRRLNPGNLLCYISFNGTKTSLLFFVVTEKELSKTVGRVGLVSDSENATIHVSLATRSQMDFELMTQLRCEQTRGLLVELHGVIPGTFIPVLENLQDIIIVSLVRSNKRKDPGFLKTKNRINVLLSRAQHGLYLIGNAETMFNAPMWNRVIDLLQEKGSIGRSFGLCCPRHMDTTLEASTPDDFARVSPEGGCRLLCDRNLSGCDHLCQARCHSEAMHLSFSCAEDCERTHDSCGHLCNKTCGEKCGDCKVKVDDVEFSCGHLNHGIPCFKTNLVLLGEVPCKAVVSENIPICGHGVDRKCSENIDFDIFKCVQPCDEVLPCGDKCPGTCGTCKRKGDDGEIVVKHRVCSKFCDRAFPTCNHKCLSRCHGDSDCGPCLNPCQVISNSFHDREKLTLNR